MTPPTPRPSFRPSLVTPPSVSTLVRRWAVSSQQTARRNAMVASTACADRRAARLEVEEFLLAASAPRSAQRAAHG